jgi:hypothetical protein
MKTVTRRRSASRGAICTTLLAGLAVVACNNSQPSPSGAGPTALAPPADAHSIATLADSSIDAETESLAEEDDTAAQDILEHHRYHVGGLTGFTLMSLDTLGVPDERRGQIDNIQSTLEAGMEPVHDAERGLLSTLATGVAAGRVNPHDVDAALARIKTTAEASRRVSSTAMTQLHAALTEVERATLIDKIMAHWEVWKAANAAELDAGVDGRRRGCRLSRLTDEVGLSPPQVDAIRTALRTTPWVLPAVSNTELSDDVGTRLDTFRVAFANDAFDANSVDSCTGADAHLAVSGASRMARFFSIATPLLSVAQRTTLAAHLREHLGNSGDEAHTR